MHRSLIVALLLLGACAPPPAQQPEQATPSASPSPVATPAGPVATPPPAVESPSPAAGEPLMPPGGDSLDAARLAELQATLSQVLDLCAQAKGASSQGRARMIKKQIDNLLSPSDMAIPFRSNLERMATILSETEGDEPSEEQKVELRKEVQTIASELGIQTGGDGGSGTTGVPMPGPPGPPVPGPPGPRPPGP